MPIKKLSAGAVVAGVASLIIYGAVLTALLSVYRLADKQAGIPATVFVTVNLLVLLLLVPFGRSVSESTSFATLAQVWSVTILYSAVQFISLFLFSDAWGNIAYTLFQLIILALWFGIAGAAIVVGIRNHKKGG